MIIEWAKGKCTTQFRGSKPPTYVLSEIQVGSKEPIMNIDQPGFILIDIPVVNGKQMLFDFNAVLKVRFLSEGVVYSFKSGCLRVHPKPSVIVIEYPVKLERHNLRGDERMKFMTMGEAEKPGGGAKKPCAIIDISPNGAMVGLEEQDGVVPGGTLVLSFRQPDGQRVEKLKATVRNIRREEGGCFLGVSFNEGAKDGLPNLRAYYNTYAGYLEGVK